MTTPTAPTLPWMTAAAALLERARRRPRPRRSRPPASGRAEAIAADGLVHLFGTGHSRIPVEEMFPRYGSYPGFNPIVELSMTFHTQVVGANGQRQAMFIERTPGLAEVILSNFTFGPQDVMIVFSAGGTTAVPVEMARGARRPRPAGHRRHVGPRSRCRPTSTRRVGSRLLDEADLVIDLCTPAGRRDGRHRRASTRPVGPGSTLAAVAIVNSIKVRTAELLTERGAMPPVLTRAASSGAERSRDAVRRRLSRACAAARPCDRPTRRWMTERRAARIPAMMVRPTTHEGTRGRRKEEWSLMKRIGLARGARRRRPRLAIVAGACSSTPAASGGSGRHDAKYTIGFSNPGGVGNGWREAMLCSAKAQAVKAGNVTKVTIIHRDTDAAGQLADIRTLIAQGVNAIIINPADPDALNPAIAEAIDGRHHRRRRRRVRHRARRLQPVQRPGAVRLPRRHVAVQAARRQGRRRLHARHRRPSGRHRPRHGLQEGARGEPGHQGRQATSSRSGTRPRRTQQINDIMSAGTKFDGIWTSGIDSNIVDALKAANHPYVPIVGADNAGFVTQLLNEPTARRAPRSPTRRRSAAPASPSPSRSSAARSRRQRPST